MGVNLRLPNINGLTEKEQLLQLRTYLYQLVGDLQFALNSSSFSSDSVVVSSKKDGGNSMNANTVFAALKPLIMKSADIIDAYYAKITTKFKDDYVAQSAFNTYIEKTTREIEELANATELAFGDIKAIDAEVSDALSNLKQELENTAEELGELIGFLDKEVGDIDDFLNSGGVDTFTLGIVLAATADTPITLANIITPGLYYSPDATNTQYITDSPYTGGGFNLEVRQIQHKNYIRQTLRYDSTTLLRHYNGSGWSDWVCVMVLPIDSNKACADLVVAQGTNGGWTYKKWESGTYEMFGTFEVSPGNSTLQASLYYTDSINISPPFAITSAYVSGTAVGPFWLTNAGLSSEGNVILKIASDVAIDINASIKVCLRVVGTYE